MDMVFEIIGVIAGLATAVPSIPQIINTIKSKDVEGVSITMFCIWALGGFCWVLYGWYIGSWQMVVFNTISTLCSLTMICLILKYGKKIKKKAK